MHVKTLGKKPSNNLRPSTTAFLLKWQLFHLCLYLPIFLIYICSSFLSISNHLCCLYLLNFVVYICSPLLSISAHLCCPYLLISLIYICSSLLSVPAHLSYLYLLIFVVCIWSSFLSISAHLCSRGDVSIMKIILQSEHVHEKTKLSQNIE